MMRTILILFISIDILISLIFISKKIERDFNYSICTNFKVKDQEMGIEIGKRILNIYFTKEKIKKYTIYSIQDVGSIALLVSARQPPDSTKLILGGNPTVLFNRYTLKVYEIYWPK